MNYTFDFPSYTIGKDSYFKINDVCIKYGTKAIVIGGKTAMEKAKPYFEKALKESNIKILDYIWYGGEASFENCDMILQNKYIQDADMIFGVGGGKAIDTSKEVQIRTSLPLFTFPTIASTCASATKISITYYPTGESRETLKMEKPPIHVFINTEIIANAPSIYLWAGIGDTLAKYYEVSFSCRDRELDYLNSMALQLAPLSANPLIKYGKKAYEDIQMNNVTYELEQVILDIIISTGFVSILIDHKYNTALAHAIYYGLTVIDVIKDKHLHGEVVSYGVLVQLILDNDLKEFDRIYKFNKSLNLPTCLSDLDLNIDSPDLLKAITKAANNSGLEIVPYKITETMIYDAINDIEKMKKYN